MSTMTPEERVEILLQDSMQLLEVAITEAEADARAKELERLAAVAWHTMQHAFVPEATMLEVDAAIRNRQAESDEAQSREEDPSDG